MTSRTGSRARAFRTICTTVAVGILLGGNAMAGIIEVFHADSLAGPMNELKKAFEAKNKGVAINLTPGVSKQLEERILKGEICDIFAPSSQAVADDLLSKKGMAWYVVFSANEMVVITTKSNPLGIRQISDLAKPGIKFIRITGEKDLGTNRTIVFLKKAAAAEGKPELAQKIVDSAMSDPVKPTSVPDTVRAVKEGKANAGVVYYSAAVAARNDIDIIRFPASINVSEEIRNAAGIPATAKNPKEATDFVRFILSYEGQTILAQTGQPPVVPAIRAGDVPADVKN
jgi:molybdate transport system substrate-binding protein